MTAGPVTAELSSVASSSSASPAMSPTGNADDQQQQQQHQFLGQHLRIATAASQGGRKYMEDRMQIETSWTASGLLDYTFLGIFDGHGGAEAAQFCRDHLYKNILSQSGFNSMVDDEVLAAIRAGFLETHQQMRDDIHTWPRTPSGYESTAGTTATVVFIRRGKLYTGHVGDSAIYVGSEDADGAIDGCRLTIDHKPDSIEEHQRIVEDGGQVLNKSGVWRVVWTRVARGSQAWSLGWKPEDDAAKDAPLESVAFLAVARALGDLWSYCARTKKFTVSPEPDVAVYTLTANDRCLVLGSDGMTNVMRAQEAAEIVLEPEGSPYPIRDSSAGLIPPANPARVLLSRALLGWSNLRADNISIATVHFELPTTGGGNASSQPPARRHMSVDQELSDRPDRVLRVTPLEVQSLPARHTPIVYCGARDAMFKPVNFHGPGFVDEEYERKLRLEAEAARRRQQQLQLQHPKAYTSSSSDSDDAPSDEDEQAPGEEGEEVGNDTVPAKTTTTTTTTAVRVQKVEDQPKKDVNAMRQKEEEAETTHLLDRTTVAETPLQEKTTPLPRRRRGVAIRGGVSLLTTHLTPSSSTKRARPADDDDETNDGGARADDVESTELENEGEEEAENKPKKAIATPSTTSTFSAAKKKKLSEDDDDNSKPATTTTTTMTPMQTRRSVSNAVVATPTTNNPSRWASFRHAIVHKEGEGEVEDDVDDDDERAEEDKGNPLLHSTRPLYSTSRRANVLQARNGAAETGGAGTTPITTKQQQAAMMVTTRSAARRARMVEEEEKMENSAGAKKRKAQEGGGGDDDGDQKKTPEKCDRLDDWNRLLRSASARASTRAGRVRATPTRRRLQQQKTPMIEMGQLKLCTPAGLNVSGDASAIAVPTTAGERAQSAPTTPIKVPAVATATTKQAAAKMSKKGGGGGGAMFGWLHRVFQQD